MDYQKYVMEIVIFYLKKYDILLSSEDLLKQKYFKIKIINKNIRTPNIIELMKRLIISQINKHRITYILESESSNKNSLKYYL